VHIPLALQSALISVATATVVTLIVEYAAKPRLEAGIETSPKWPRK
jgi:hypothetical protein